MGVKIFVAGVAAAVITAALLAPVSAGAASKTPDRWSSEAAGGGQTYANTGESIITPRTASKLTERWHASNGSSYVAPAVVDDVVYRAVNPTNVSKHAIFVASSARTGTRSWQLTLPHSEYYRGQSVASGIAVLPFEGQRTLGGVTAVDLRTHVVLWSRSRPASMRNPGNDDGTGGPIAVAAGRVYLLAGNNDLSAYSLRTGTLLWHRDPAAGVKAIAAAGGRLYTGGYPGGGGPGLVAYDGATGAKQWSAAGLDGQPVVDGSRVLALTGDGVGAARAAGCGAASCKLIWSRGLDANTDSTFIGGATPTTFYVAYEPLSSDNGRLDRVSTTTGGVRWTYRTTQPIGEIPIRAGTIVWALTGLRTVKGWSVSASSTSALKAIHLPAADNGAAGGLADADGSLVVDIFAGDLTTYRVPGS